MVAGGYSRMDNCRPILHQNMHWAGTWSVDVSPTLHSIVEYMRDEGFSRGPFFLDDGMQIKTRGWWFMIYIFFNMGISIHMYTFEPSKIVTIVVQARGVDLCLDEFASRHWIFSFLLLKLMALVIIVVYRECL